MDSDADFSAILPWFLEMIPFNVQTKKPEPGRRGQKNALRKHPFKLLFSQPIIIATENAGKSGFYPLPGIVLFFNGFLFLPRVHFPGGDEGIHQFRDLGG